MRACAAARRRRRPPRRQTSNDGVCRAHTKKGQRSEPHARVRTPRSLAAPTRRRPWGKKRGEGQKRKKRPPSKAFNNNDDDDDLKRNPDACVRAGRRDAQRSALFCVCVGCVPLNSCVHVWLDAPQRRRRISPALFGVCCPKPTGPPWGARKRGKRPLTAGGQQNASRDVMMGLASSSPRACVLCARAQKQSATLPTHAHARPQGRQEQGG